MLRALLLTAALAVVAVMAQAPPKPEPRDSSYATYDQQPQYQTYAAPAPQYYSSPPLPKFQVDKLLNGLVLPSAHDIITGIIYVVAVAGVAGLVLIGLALVLKLFSLKLPLINELKQSVISKVEKVDSRMLESAWQTLLNSFDKFQ